MSGTTVVLGATGGIGGAVVDALVTRGVPVRAVSRSAGALPPRPGVQARSADLTDPAALAAVVAGADVVHHCAQPPYARWAQEFPAMNRAVVDACAAAGAALVVADNLYCYGPQHGPMTESTPQLATDAKGRLRAALADELLAAHRAGRVRVTLGRISDYHGPGGVDTGLGETLYGRLVAGRKARWIGSLDQPHTVSYLPDVGEALVTLGERREEAAGRAWHLPAGPPPTGRQLLALIGAALGRPATASTVGGRTLRVLGVAAPMLRELAGIAYQWEQPFVADDAAFRAVFGPVRVTPHDEAVRATVAWWRGRPAG